MDELDGCSRAITRGMEDLHRMFQEQRKRLEVGVRARREYREGLRRLGECVRGYFSWITMTNFSYEMMLHMAPTTLHLFFPGMVQRLRAEVCRALGFPHGKNCAVFVAGRGWGKTTSAIAWLSNVILSTSGSFDVAFLGEQETHAKNMLSMLKSMMRSHETEVSRAVQCVEKDSALHLHLARKDGGRVRVACFPGRGEKFRGDNSIKLILFDEFFFADWDFVEKKYMPHLTRVHIGSINLTTPSPGSPSSKKFSKSNDLFDVVSRGSDEVPRMSWIKESAREQLAGMMDDDVAQTELYGLVIRQRNLLFSEDRIDAMLGSTGRGVMAEYVAGVDPSDEGRSENAVAILGVRRASGCAVYSVAFLHSFVSNDYSSKVEKIVGCFDCFRRKYFQGGSGAFRRKGDPARNNVYVFVESCSGGPASCIRKSLDGLDDSVVRFHVMRGMNWSARSKSFQSYGFSKTGDRTRRYVRDLSDVLARSAGGSPLWVDEKFCTDTTEDYNTARLQLQKLGRQLKNFRNVGGKYTGKVSETGRAVNDDLAVAFMSAISMEVEMHGSEKLRSEKARVLREYWSSKGARRPTY